MKKLLYLLICLPLIFNSCKKDDDSPNNGDGNTSGSILGSWELTEGRRIETEGYYDSNGNKVITDTGEEIIAPGFDGLLSVTWTFSSGGALNEMAVSEYDVYTKSYSYQKSGNTLILNSEWIFSITTLSSSKLTINTGEEYTEEEDGTVYFEEYNQTMKFDKLAFAPDNSNSKKIKSNKDSFFKTSIDRRKKR
jgi:hypothetical protein